MSDPQAASRPTAAGSPFAVPADALPHPVWASGPDGSVQRWNAAWAEWTGMPVWQGTGWSWLDSIHPSDREAVRAAYVDAISRRELFSIPVRLWNKDAGEYQHHVLRGMPNRDLSDAVVGWCGTLTPTGAAASRDSDYEAQAGREEAERAKDELQQFAYVVSHDLREPARMVISYLSLLERRYIDTLDENAKEYISYAIEGGSRINRLLDDLLAYSRVVGGEATPLRPVSMNGAVQWAMMNLAAEIRESGAHIVAEDLPTVNADENRIVIVVQQLLSNAIKFRGEAVPEIRVTAEERESEWLFCVEDNGVGFNSQYAERAFGVFKRLHGKQYPGTGMGLALARKIIDRHGGRIWAESTPGQGSRFFFTLPI